MGPFVGIRRLGKELAWRAYGTNQELFFDILGLNIKCMQVFFSNYTAFEEGA